VLPDYQGIGLGTQFLNIVADYYKQLGFDFRIVTSAKNMIYALNKSAKWKMIRWSVNKCNSDKSKIDGNRPSMRNNCRTGGVPLHLTIGKSIRTDCKTAAFIYQR
jgi:GNAT superfamily N-acetyltransferase